MQRDGKVAIVTRVSSGIGQASAKALHQAGFRVFGTSRRQGMLETMAKSVARNAGAAARWRHRASGDRPARNGEPAA